MGACSLIMDSSPVGQVSLQRVELWQPQSLSVRSHKTVMPFTQALNELVSGQIRLLPTIMRMIGIVIIWESLHLVVSKAKAQLLCKRPIPLYCGFVIGQ